MFRSDIEGARAVIFAGYSVSDLHVGSILVAIESLRKKCVFIVGPKPSIVQKTTLEKFGTISPEPGVADAAKILDSVVESHKPTRTLGQACSLSLHYAPFGTKVTFPTCSKECSAGLGNGDSISARIGALRVT